MGRIAGYYAVAIALNAAAVYNLYQARKFRSELMDERIRHMIAAQESYARRGEEA